MLSPSQLGFFSHDMASGKQSPSLLPVNLPPQRPPQHLSGWLASDVGGVASLDGEKGSLTAADLLGRLALGPVPFVSL